MADFCVKCGAKVEKTYKFCMKCGAPVIIQKNEVSESIDEEQKIDETSTMDEDKFYLTTGRKEKRLIAEGKGARLLNNGIKAFEMLNNEGLGNFNTDIASWTLLDEKFDIEDENCTILSPEAIVKLWKIDQFFECIGYRNSYSWIDIPSIIED